MRFYVVGSCRVHGPLRAKVGYQPVLPGYTHTAKEAIQRLRFVRGDLQIPNPVAPYVFSRRVAPKVSRKHLQALENSDVTLVEICSSKEVSRDGYWLNLNYAAGAAADVREASDLEGDIQALASMCPRLMIVQHVELPGIPDRTRFAGQLRDVCAQLNVPVFRPSDFITTNDMLDANHYAPSALDGIGERLVAFMKIGYGG